jgi:hypothetical protein
MREVNNWEIIILKLASGQLIMNPLQITRAEVAELVDAHDSGSCVRKGVEVRVFSSAFL